MISCQVECILQVTMVIRIFQFLAPMLISLVLYSNNSVINWISTEIKPEKIDPFDATLIVTMSNLANVSVILKFDNSVLVEKGFS